LTGCLDLRTRHHKGQFIRSDLNRLTVVQHKGIEDFFAIHIRAVIALLVLNHIANIAAPNNCVAARDAAIIRQSDIIRCKPTYGDFIFVQPILFELPVCPSQDKPGRALLRARRNQGHFICAWLLIIF
jgi:hypothetical protein